MSKRNDILFFLFNLFSFSECRKSERIYMKNNIWSGNVWRMIRSCKWLWKRVSWVRFALAESIPSPFRHISRPEWMHTGGILYTRGCWTESDESRNSDINAELVHRFPWKRNVTSLHFAALAARNAKLIMTKALARRPRHPRQRKSASRSPRKWDDMSQMCPWLPIYCFRGASEVFQIYIGLLPPVRLMCADKNNTKIPIPEIFTSSGDRFMGEIAATILSLNFFRMWKYKPGSRARKIRFPSAVRGHSKGRASPKTNRPGLKRPNVPLNQQTALCAFERTRICDTKKVANSGLSSGFGVIEYFSDPSVHSCNDFEWFGIRIKTNSPLVRHKNTLQPDPRPQCLCFMLFGEIDFLH